jgi:hypothetical protein
MKSSMCLGYIRGMRTLWRSEQSWYSRAVIVLSLGGQNPRPSARVGARANAAPEPPWDQIARVVGWVSNVPAFIPDDGHGPLGAAPSNST